SFHPLFLVLFLSFHFHYFSNCSIIPAVFLSSLIAVGLLGFSSFSLWVGTTPSLLLPL
ncbi:hypothetical protein P175DRAFT_0452244, partial [Aspergillus ochraceoroseus IBT 24754]